MENEHGDQHADGAARVTAAEVVAAAHEFARVLRAVSFHGGEIAARRRAMGEIPEVAAQSLWENQDDYLDALEALWRVGELSHVAQAHLITDTLRIEQAQAETQREKRDAARTVCSEVGMILKKSPHATSSLVRASTQLVEHLPNTLEALADGRIGMDVAQVIAKETENVPVNIAQGVDCVIEDDLASLADAGVRQWRHQIRTRVLDVNPEGEEGRAAKAREERWVRVSELEHGMAMLSARLAAPDAYAIAHVLKDTATGVAKQRQESARAHARQALGQGAKNFGEKVLDRVAHAAEAHGVASQADEADALVNLLLSGEKLENQRRVRIGVVLNASALASGDPTDAGAWIPEYGPITGTDAFDFVARERERGTELSITRLYAHPDSGELVAVDSKARAFPEGLATLIRLRDRGVCRAPHCNAPIRTIDHILRWSDGGPTTFENGQGLCARCNLAKEKLARVIRRPDGTVEYTSRHGTQACSPPPRRKHLPPGRSG